MLDKKELLEYTKNLDKNIELGKLEIKAIKNSFVNKVIKNLKNHKEFSKIDFDEIIPYEEYNILSNIDDLEFDVNELYMDLLVKYNYQLYIDTNGIQYIVEM